MTESKPGATESEILAKGVRFVARYEEPFDGKASEEVLIGFIKTRDINAPAIQMPDQDPAKFLAFVCGRSVAWANALTVDSLMDAMEEARRINRRFFDLLNQRAESIAHMPDALIEKLIAAGRANEATEDGRPAFQSPGRITRR